MSRAPDVPGIIDIRSAAILQAYVFSTNACAPGAIEARKRKCYYHDISILGDSIPQNYDNSKSFIACGAAFVVIAGIMGILYSTPVFIPAMMTLLDIGLVEVVMVIVLTFSIFIKMSTIACFFIEVLGARMTAISGMIWFFIGLLLEGLFSPPLVNSEIFYISYLVFYSIGASFAYTASMSLVSDHFREHLGVALTVMTVASSLGTMLFYWLCNFLLTYVGIKWTKLILAAVVLFLIGVTHSFGNVRKNKPENEGKSLHREGWNQREEQIRKCIKAGTQTELQGTKSFISPSPTDDCEAVQDHKSCLCVFICDISLWGDWSFLLWAIISSIGLMPFLVPYIFINAFAWETGTDYTVDLIIWFCLASAATRAATMLGNDHTFFYNRTVFQIGVMASGALYIVASWLETYGWILVWGVALGAMEGIIATSIPRVTLMTIPRKWLISSWSCILWFHCFGAAFGPIFVAGVKRTTGEYFVGFVAIGVSQLIAGVLAFLLPNEEGEELDTTTTSSVTDNKNGAVNTGALFQSYSSRYNSNSIYGGGGAYYKRYGMYSNSSNYPAGFGLSNAAGFGSTGSGGSGTYTCNCPICSKYGCIPNCTPCTPGGLVQSGGIKPSEDPCVEETAKEKKSNIIQLTKPAR